ncbi:Tol-Pal system beta propeller repeat protein TolB [Lentisalinibacter orientalis]|uniref:Tol-Pal system beta propeller repeat protein TolB n=1 Tax=Lentisalinibacter orientalis TaxID=2992241 RepID=UPI00386BD1F9
MKRALILIALMACAGVARAELTIEITQGAGQAVPVAVVPFGWDGPGEAPLDVAAVIGADLARSGRFEPLERRDMLARPTRGVEIDFDDWRMVGSDLIVVGRLVREAEDDYTIEFQLFDILRGEQLVGYRMPASKRGLRLAAHRAADMIFEEITGIPGVFATRIAYITAEGEDATNRTYRLIVSDADGANQYTIVESAQPLMSPTWSPDGRRIAYVSFEGNRSAVWVQTLRTGNRQRLSQEQGINGAPAWSPDGRRIALTLSGADGNPDIWLLTVASGEKRRLTTNPAIDTEAAWAPDGKSIYFTSDRSGGPQIYRVGVDGGNASRVTFEGRYNARPRISPDGSKLAVVHDDRGNYRIAVYDLENDLFQVLSDGRLDESPDFAPNGATLIYATRQGDRGVLATVSVDGTVKQRLASTGGDVREPVWSPFRRNY